MGDLWGFLKRARKEEKYRDISERIKDFKDVVVKRDKETSLEQSSRCMDCGTPFCHWACPVGNYIPEWNDFLFKGDIKKAWELLSQTNPFPEFTGRLCPAPCEYGCVLEINDEPVTIRMNELDIVEFAFENGFVKPDEVLKRTGKKVAVIGSGPSGLSAAVELNKKGHKVFVFEKDKKLGGLLRYGIPDFKLEKWVINRRIEIMKKSGIEFSTGIEIGKDITLKELKEKFDAVVICSGARVPRDIKVPGREAENIYFALDFLSYANKKVSGEKLDFEIDVSNKRVAVIGGGDTGSDCIGVAKRFGAKKIIQIELLPKPPEKRPENTPWPYYPILYKTTSSHKEAEPERLYSTLTKEFIKDGGKVKGLRCVKLNFVNENNKMKMEEIKGSEFEIKADFVVIAAGFLYPDRTTFKGIDLELTERGNIKTDKNFMTNIEGIFSAGDCRRGQSLIVWAIQEGKEVSNSVDEFLKN